jgi:iron complex transport system substrate-binding protein
MRLFQAPPSGRSEGSLHVRLLTLVGTALIAVGCTTGGSGGFTAAPVSSVAPSLSASPASSAPASLSAAPASSAPAAPSASPAPTPAPSVSASPSEAITWPLTLTDDEQNAVVIPAEPRKIVSLTPATTEVVYALGIGDRLLADTDADDFPPEAKKLPHVATYSSVDVEKIVGLDADLVIAGGNNFNKPEALAQLRRLGIPVVVVYGADIEGVLHDVDLVAQAVGRPGEGAALVDGMRAQFKVVSDATANLPHPRTFYELDATKEIYGPADKSFLAEMISLAGGTPITTGSTTVFSIALEKLVAANPEVIVLGDAAYGTTPEIVAARPGWNSMTAVKTGAIRPVNDTVVSRPGPRLVEGLRDLAIAIHPDLVLPPLPSPSTSASPGAASPVASGSPAAASPAATY